MDRLGINGLLNSEPVLIHDYQYNLNRRIRDSYVTKLEPHHTPDEFMSSKILLLINTFGYSDSIDYTISLKKEILAELNNMHTELSELRKSIFDIENRGTNQVYGILKNGFTASDRDFYIKKLICYHDAVCKVTNVTKTEYDGYFFIQVPTFHHTSSLYGDIAALESILEGNDAKLPDLTYNLGDLQFG